MIINFFQQFLDKRFINIKRFQRIFFERIAKFHVNDLIFISLQNQNTSYSALYITIFLNEPIINILILKWCLSKYRKCVRKFETNVFICALFWPKISCHYGKEEANWYTRQRNTYFSILLHFHAMYSSVSLLRRFIHITFQGNYLKMKLTW